MKFIGNNPNGLNLVSKSLIELDIDGQSKVAFSNEYLSVVGNITASQNIKAQNHLSVYVFNPFHCNTCAQTIEYINCQ